MCRHIAKPKGLFFVDVFLIFYFRICRFELNLKSVTIFQHLCFCVRCVHHFLGKLIFKLAKIPTHQAKSYLPVAVFTLISMRLNIRFFSPFFLHSLTCLQFILISFRLSVRGMCVCLLIILCRIKNIFIYFFSSFDLSFT